MALISCPECKREISNKAPACIHCGCPLLFEPPSSEPSQSKLVNLEQVNQEVFSEYPDVVSVGDAGKMLNICKSTMYQLLLSNKIQHLKVGKKYIIPKKSIVRFLESGYDAS